MQRPVLEERDEVAFRASGSRFTVGNLALSKLKDMRVSSFYTIQIISGRLPIPISK